MSRMLKNIDLIPLNDFHPRLPIYLVNWEMLKVCPYNVTFIMSCDGIDKREISRLEGFISIISSLGCCRNLEFNSYAIFRTNVQKLLILVLASCADIFKIKYDLVVISNYIHENGK